MQLLTAAPVIEQLKKELIVKQKQLLKYLPDAYLAIFLVGDNNPCQTYVRAKKKFAEEIGLACKVLGQTEGGESARTLEKILQEINRCNIDKNCMGIIIQIPLSPELQPYKDRICAAVTPEKDIDGLGGIICGYNQIGICSFLPATVQGIFTLRDFYQLGNRKGRKVAVIGQGDVVGKPFAIECLRRGAEIRTFTDQDSKSTITAYCQQAEIIVSCTGVCHLIDDTFLNNQANQILIDVGFGNINGKAAGDVCFEKVEGKVKAVTPVPGGIGPMTVVSIFQNLFTLYTQKTNIETILHPLLSSQTGKFF